MARGSPAKEDNHRGRPGHLCGNVDSPLRRAFHRHDGQRSAVHLCHGGHRCEQYGVQHITTTAFHPQANGMVERLHPQMKDALLARGGAAAWADHLLWVMLGIRASPRRSLGPLQGRQHSRTCWWFLISCCRCLAHQQLSWWPKGPTLRQLQHQLWRGQFTCKCRVWDCRWRTTMQGHTWCWRRAPRSSSSS